MERAQREDEMSDIERLECGVYLVESEMYLASSQLQTALHKLEGEIRGMADDVHRLLCESGRIPGEKKAFDILARIRETVTGLDLAPATELAESVASLKGEIEGYERQLAALREESTPREERSLRVVA